MRIGIVGAGQLAQMTAQAAKSLHVETLCLAFSADECAGRESPLQVVTAFDAAHADAFASAADILTIETENIPLDFATRLATQKPLYPPVEALATAQDRLFEKQLFEHVGLSPAPYAVINRVEDVSEVLAKVGVPGILKTRRMGYDGKGQIRCYTEADLIAGVNALLPAPLIYEGWVTFDREASLIGVRSQTGEVAFYPLCENTHQDGILRITKAPYDDVALAQQAQSYMTKIFDEMNYVGVLTIEFFVKGERLLGNEMAPRVHNSGHWTIEGAETSQFENHVRAITGMPLGSCAVRKYSVMVNCIGALPNPVEIAMIAGAHYHHYGKAVKPLRKVGHVTVVASTAEEADVLSHRVLTCFNV